MKQAIVVLILCLVCGLARADGTTVDKVYHPYVLPLEREFEWRIMFQEEESHPGDNVLSQRLGYGHGLSETVSLEAYLIGERAGGENFAVTGYELELRWMLTEQGELWADWGMLFEFEREEDGDNFEATAGVLFEKEIGRTSLTINVFAIYEWGQIENEWESEFRLKYRYRWIPQVQPAVEVYAGEDFLGIGPAFMGVQRYEKQKQLKWEAGLIFGIGADSTETTFRFALEYEF